MSKKQLIIWICTGIILVILAGCSNKNEEKSIEERDDEAVDEQMEENAKTDHPDDLPLSDFFLSDGKKASFKGDGDEFATFSLRSEEHTSELQSRFDLVCRLLLE